MDVREEQLLAVERDAMWHSDITDVDARPRRINRLHHRLLCTDTFEHGVGADSFRQLLDTCNSLIAALSDNVGRPEFARKLLSSRVAAHSDDSLCAHLFCGEHAEQPDRAITNDRNGRTWFHVCRIGGEPPCAHNIR